MPENDALAAERAVAILTARLASDPRLQAELQRARREFCRAPAGTASVPGASDATEQRFREWFLLERESELLGAVPVELPQSEPESADLADSAAGLYLVESVGAGGAAARDLQDDTALDLAVPEASLQPGDLVVGRLYAVGAGRFAPSSAAGIFRPGADLARAFLRDLERLQLGRRLQQIELEHLLLQRPGQLDRSSGLPAAVPPSAPLEHLEADLDRLLTNAGSEYSAAELSQQLAVALRPGPVIGPVLDELAFDTEVDLDRARALLLELWNAHHEPGEAGPGEAGGLGATPPGETLGERLVRTLDEGLAQKRDVADLFAQLEQMAGIEPEPEDDDAGEDEEDDDEDDAPVARPRRDDGDEPGGNLGPLVEEYLWETERSTDPAAAPLRLFATLQQNAALPHVDLEEITSTDVMRLLLHVYLGAAPRERAGAVRLAFEQVRGFYQWAEATQEMELGAVLAGCRGALLDHLDRLQAASEALSTSTRPAARPGILTVEDLGPSGFGASDDEGGDHWLQAPGEALSHLRVGDLVLGALGPPDAAARGGRALAGLVVVLPAEAKTLME